MRPANLQYVPGDLEMDSSAGIRAHSDPGRGPRRSLVIPMFREASRIERTISRIARSPLNDRATELILVDDGSDDGTAEIASGALSVHGVRARILRLEVNRGKGSAVRTGVLAATGDLVAFADADLSADVPEIEECFRVLDAEDVDIVVATRAAEDSRIPRAQSPIRQFSGKLFNALIRAMRLTEIPDTQCGLKGFRATAARHLFSRMTIERFAFDVEILLRAQQCGYVMRELPIEWCHVEASRVSLLRDSTRMLADIVRLRRQLRKEASIARNSAYARSEV